MHSSSRNWHKKKPSRQSVPTTHVASYLWYFQNHKKAHTNTFDIYAVVLRSLSVSPYLFRAQIKINKHLPMFGAMISICMEWDAYKMHPTNPHTHKMQTIKSKSHILLSLFRPQWRVCTFDCVHSKVGNEFRSGDSCSSMGRSWHKHTHTHRHNHIRNVSFFRFKWTMATLAVFGAAAEFVYLDSFIFDSSKLWQPNYWMIVFFFSFASSSSLAIV